MNTQERDQLNQLLKQLIEFKLSSKDSEAESLIQQAVAHQPDATYLLVQRALLLEHALNNAKAQINDLQRQLQNSQPANNSGSFLGADPWAQPTSNNAGVPGAANYQPNRYAQPMPQQVPAQPQPQAGGLFGGGSFLGNVATTAAGVMAGSFLFQGIENLMGHHGGGFGQSGFGGAGFDQAPFGEHISEQTVINNYYGDDAGQYADNGDFSGNNMMPASDDIFSGGNDDFADNSDDSDWI